MANEDTPFSPESTPVQDAINVASQAPSAEATNVSQLKPMAADDLPQDESWDDDKTEVLPDLADDEVKAWLAVSGEKVEIRHFPFIVGRAQGCDYIPQGRGISRKHVEIGFQSGRFVIEDLDSLNGVKVNGYQVKRVILEDCDDIVIGDCKMQFRHIEVDGATEKLDSPVASSPLSKLPLKTVGIAAGVIVVGSLLMMSFKAFQGSQAPQTAAVPTETHAAQAAPPAPAAAPAPTVAPQPAAAPAVAAAPVPEVPAPQVAREQVPVLAVNETVAAAPEVAEASAPAASQAASPLKVMTLEEATTPAAPVQEKPKGPTPEELAERKRKAAQQKRDTTASNVVKQSVDGYMKGNALATIEKLQKVAGDRQISQSVRNRANASINKIKPLFEQYQAADAAYKEGRKDEAFNQWVSFLSNEKKTFKKASSVYAGEVSNRVADEYIARVKAAQDEGRHHDAYRLLQAAAKTKSAERAKILLSGLDAQGKQLYRKGMRYEFVNSEKAQNYWREVTQLLPPTAEYHTKASAKLSWYERWGTN